MKLEAIDLWRKEIIEPRKGEWMSYEFFHPCFIPSDKLEWTRKNMGVIPDELTTPDEDLKGLDISILHPVFNIAGLWWRIKNENQ